jgi:geranylgeranyl diphosphate synthase, type I
MAPSSLAAAASLTVMASDGTGRPDRPDDPASAGYLGGRRAGVDHADADPARLGAIRLEVGKALEFFLRQQRAVLSDISRDMVPWLEAMDGLLAGGKRLRPAFCYWGWRAAGGIECPEIYTAAAALELLQASALIHDDVMDASDTRRGRPAVHKQFAARHQAAGHAGSADQFGAGAAILIGDALLAWTDQLYHGSGLPADALRRGQPALNAMRTEVAAGQYLDLMNQVSGTASFAAAMRVVTYKTAKYTIERPLHLGVALAGCPQLAACSPTDPRPQTGQPGTSSADSRVGTASLDGTCSAYGIPLGIAFQLRDDVLGIFGDPAKTGKPVTGDIREGKQTVLMALTHERASARQAELLDRHLGDRALSEPAAAEVRAVIADTGALAECEAMIAASAKEAIGALDGAPIQDEARVALTALAVMATDRED